MKKLTYIFALLALSLVACNKILDVNPTASVPAENAINTPTGVDRAMAGAYNALQATGLYGRYSVVLGDLAADNLSWTGTTLDYGQIENKPTPAENGIIDGFWSASYDGINRLNNILYYLPGISYQDQSAKLQAEGEALFLRALLHYNLVQYFGDVPLRENPTLDLSSIDAPRVEVLKIYNKLLSDLKKATTQLPTERIQGKANMFAAKALMAKIYLSLYFDHGNKAYADSAIIMSSDVISNSGCLLDPDFKNLFGPLGYSSESIFEVSFDVQNYNRLAQYFYTRDSSGRYEFAPTPGLVQLLNADSVRTKASIRYDKNNNPFGIKYTDVAGGVDRVYVFRLAEMYLLRAEAYAYSSSDSISIKNDLNTIRRRVNLPDITTNSPDELKLAVENENRAEFAFEGHRWLDLVRTGRATTVLGIDPNYTLFPIPLSEMTTNKLIGSQNEGY